MVSEFSMLGEKTNDFINPKETGGWKRPSLHS
jgi:hypothetical protein